MVWRLFRCVDASRCGCLRCSLDAQKSACPVSCMSRGHAIEVVRFGLMHRASGNMFHEMSGMHIRCERAGTDLACLALCRKEAGRRHQVLENEQVTYLVVSQSTDVLR